MIKFTTLLLKFHIHPLFWLIIAIGILTANFKELIILFSIVFIHEMGHAIAAHFFSWRIKKIMLFPFGGIVETDEHGNKPIKEEFIVIIAGPLQHFWMIAVSYGLNYFHVIPVELHQLFLYHNLLILTFNLLPIWPLDGGKMLFLLLSLKMPFQLAHRNALIISVWCIIMISSFVLFYSPTHLNSWLIIGFLIFSLIMEWKQRHFVIIQFLLERYYRREGLNGHLKPIIVDDAEKIFSILLKFQRGYIHPIIIKKRNKESFSLTEYELLDAFFTGIKINRPIGELRGMY